MTVYRTYTKINWVRSKKVDHMGHLRLTVHTGSRAGWTFHIQTLPGHSPSLVASHVDGRRVSSGHDTLVAAKAAALDLMHPAEAIGFNSARWSGNLKYQARWDDLAFAVFVDSDGALKFQWADTQSGFRSESRPVTGIKEARELTRAVLSERFGQLTPARTQQDADTPLGRLAEALWSADVVFTDSQLAAVAAKLGIA